MSIGFPLIQYVFDLIAFGVGLVFLFKSGRRLINGNYNMLHVCVIVFFAMQVLPIAVGWFSGLERVRQYYPYMYKAMTDEATNAIYDLFAIAGTSALFACSVKFPKHRPLGLKIPKIGAGAGSGIVVLLGMLTVFPIVIGLLLAPDPSIYLQFAYFSSNAGVKTGTLGSYHTGLMRTLVYIAFFATILTYYLCSSRSKTLFIVPVFLIAWVNGKRTLLLFLLIAFLVIDYIKWDREDRAYVRMLVKKSAVFLAIFLVYYVIYNQLTQKADYADDSLLYITYFSRLCNVKVAIYDLLYTNSMLDYPMQNILYDFLFFVPREVWPDKPLGYYPYFTSYVFCGMGTGVDPGYGFQVNLWSEYISNAGLIGFILAVAFIAAVVWTAEHSNSVVTYLSGSALVLLYSAYGFEHVVQMLWLLFIGSVVFNWSFGGFRKPRMEGHESSQGVHLNRDKEFLT